MSLPAAPLWRRLLALLYDILALIGLWFLVGVVAVIVKGGEIDIHDWREVGLLYGALWLVMGGYYTLSWRYGGQTLGMRPWRLLAQCSDGSGLSHARAWLRYACAWLSLLPAGAGMLLCLFDPDRRALHDRLSGTRVGLLPSQKVEGRR